MGLQRKSDSSAGESGGDGNRAMQQDSGKKLAAKANAEGMGSIEETLGVSKKHHHHHHKKKEKRRSSVAESATSPRRHFKRNDKTKTDDPQLSPVTDTPSYGRPCDKHVYQFDIIDDTIEKRAG